MTISADSPTAARVTQKRVPDFFIVGHAKCGTTALYEMLRRHPQIYMPDAKEPWFFARNPELKPSDEFSKAFAQTGKRSESLDDYLSLFDQATPEQRVGEASTSYLWSRTAPRRIAEAQPGARIIAILREPASFVRSLHLQLLQNHAETETDLLKAIALEDARREGKHIPRYSYWPEALIYSDRVHYVEQLRRYHAAFPSEQVLVLIYDDFRHDNEATVRKVLRFLDVDETAPIDVLKANPTVEVRSKRLEDTVKAVSFGRGPASRVAKTAVRAVVPHGMRRRMLDATQRRVVFGKARPADETAIAELRRRFKPEVVALSEYLGRDLTSLWGYDGVG